MDETRKGTHHASQRVGVTLHQPIPLSLPPWALCANVEQILSTIRPSRTSVNQIAAGGIDVRKAVRQWLRKAGVHTGYPKRQRRVRSGRLIVLWDVSGSMAEYISLYLPWLYSLASSSKDVAVFPFGVRVEDASSLLRQRYDRAVTSISQLPNLWESGTSMGEALQAFVGKYGDDWLRGRCTVLVISDGWDSGKPTDLAQAFAAMRKRGANIAWMHPLLRSPGFELKTRSLLAVRPYVCAWLPGGTPQELLQTIIS